MLSPWLLCIKTILFISIVESVNSWNPPCSPCRCSIPNPEKPKKVSDCSSAITSLQLRKIPQLNEETEVVFLVGQHLEVISQDAFFNGRPNSLKFVDLKNCEVRSIHVNAFRNLENLSGLDLSDNELSQIEDKTFSANSQIKILILRNNNLKVFPEEIFYNLPLLKYLDVSENKLQHIYPNQFKNNVNLERLILQSNYLTRFEESFITNLPKLSVLYLDNNPWKCDCKTKDLLRLIIDRNIDFEYNDESPSCSLPKKYKGKNWFEVKPKDLCSVPETSSKTIAEGDNFDVDCTIETINQLPIEWLFNGKPLDTSNTKKYETTSLKITPNSFLYKLKINNIKFNDIGVYKCWTNTLTGPDIQSEETILNVEKATPPTITGPSNEKKSVKTGTTNYKISCGASGKPKPEVQWLFNGAVLNLPTYGCKRRIDTNNNDLIFEKFDSSCFGNYVCHATSAGGSADKNFELQPLPETPEIIPDPSIDDHNAYEGSSVSLDCIVSEAVKIDVIWLRNSQQITPNHIYSIDVVQIDANKYNYILNIKGISYNQAGNYKCSANGVESPEYTVNVVKPKPPTIPGEKDETKLIKTGTSNYKLSCDASGIPKPEVQWLFNGAVLNLPTLGCRRKIDSNNNDLLFEIFDSSCFGNYVCQATSSGGVAEKNFELEPLPGTPEIIPDPSIDDHNAYEGSSVNLDCIVSEAVKIDVKWLRNGQQITPNHIYSIDVVQIDANKFNYILSIKGISYSQAGNYKCSANGVESPDYTINVVKPKPPTIPGPKEETKLVKTGTSNYKISCDASGTPKPEVQWLFNGAVLNLPTFGCKRRIDTNNNDLLFEIFDSSCFGNYICQATSSGGVTEKTFDIQPIPGIPEIIPDPNIDDHNAYEGSSVSLDCIVSEAIKINVKWLRDGQTITPNHIYSINIVQIEKSKFNYILSIKGISYNQAGNYKCSANGVESPDYTINVVKPKPPTIPGPKEETKLVKTGTRNYKISCDASGIPKPEIQWLFNGAVLNLPTSDCKRRINTNNNDLLFEIFDSSCFGNYVCQATSSEGVTEKNFEIQPIPGIPEIIPDPNIDDHNAYEGSSVSLDCIVSEAIKINVKWLRDGQTVTPNHIYSIDTVQIDANKINYILNIKGISYNQAGNYKCNANGVESPDYTVNVVKPKPPTIPGPKEETKLVKTGTSNYKISCDASGTPKPEVQWLFNGAVLNLPTSGCKRRIDTTNNDLLFEIFDSSCFGNYVCQATSFGGVAEKTFEIQPVPGIPEIIPDPNIDDHNAYEGSSVSIDCIVSEAVKVNVKWLRDGQTITPNHIYSINIFQIDTNKYNYILRIKGISLNEAGNYKCSANGVESPEYTVNVIEPTIEDFDGGNDLNLETGDSKDIKCKVKGVPKSAIHWEIPTCSKDSFANGETLHLRKVNCAGRYKCVVQTSRGRIEKEFNLSLKIPKIVEVKLITRYTDNEVFENEDITLSCLVDGAVKSKPHWYFKNSNTPIQNTQLYDIVTIPIDQDRYYYNLRIKNTKSSDASEYRCAIGSQVSKNVVLSVKPTEPPSIDYIPDPVTYAEDGQKDVKLECKISGSHVNAGWQSSNKLCNYKQAVEDRGDYKVAVLIIKEVSPACKGQFKCSASNKVNSVEKVVNLDIIKLQPPETEIDTNNINNEVVENDDVVLKCLIRGAAQSQPQWLFNGKYDPNKYHIVKENITDTSYWYNLVIKNIKPEDAMNYRCVIGNFEQSIPVDVKPSVLPNIVSISESKSFVVGMKNVRISCKVTGFPKPKTNWLKKGSFGDCRHTITTEQDGNSDIVHLTFLEVTLSCGGQYYCHTDNSKGTTMKDVAILVISEEKPPTIENIPSVSQVVEEEDVTLKCVVESPLQEPEWLYKGQVIQNNNKYRIEKVRITPTSYYFNLIISKVSTLDKGSYKCRINNLETEATIDVHKGKIPIIDEIPNPGPVEEGKKDLTFSCKVDGIPKPKVTWYYEGREINPQLPSNQFGCKYVLSSEMSNPTNAFRTELLYLTVKEVLPSCAGKYKCVTENSKGREQKEINLSVTKVEPPVIPQPPTEVYENSNVTLQCLIKGSVDSKPSWLHNNRKIDLNDKYKIVIIQIDQSSYWYNLEITDVSQFDRGNYKCKINNQETDINITPLKSSQPVIFRFPAKELEYKEGGRDLTLPCQATGNPLPKITWLFNNIPVDQNPNKNCPYRIVTEPGNKVSLVIQNVDPNCSGKYKCVTENIKGTNERETSIKINPTPGPKIEQELPGSHVVPNDDIKLKCLVPNRRYPAKWYKEDNEVVIVPNGRYSIDYEPINVTAYWYNLVITNIKLEDKANYKCKIHNAESVIPIDVVPSVKPTIEYMPNRETAVSEGTENFKLACKVTGIPKPKISWYAPNKNCKHTITSEVKDTSEWSILTIEKVTSICKGTYKCVTTNSAGSDEKEIDLSIVSSTIKPEVTLETKSPDGVIRQYDDVTIKCLTTGSASSKVVWYLNNRPIDTNNEDKYELNQQEVNHLTTRHSLTIKNLTDYDRGDYICKTNNIDQSIKIDIKRALLPSVEYYNSPKLIIDEGTAEVTLPCKVTDARDYAVDWTLNGRYLEDTSCTSGSTVFHEKTRYFEWYNLTINNISPSCSGKFKCVIRNLDSEDDYDIDVTVLRTKTPVIDIRASSLDKTIREKDTVTLKCLITSSKPNAAKWTYKGKEITSNDKYKITTVRIDDTSYWYNLEIPSISRQQSGEYKCSKDKTEISRVVTVNPGLKPNIEHISNSEMFVEEGTKDITLFCQAKGSPVPNVSWDLRSKPQNCDIKTSTEGNLNTQWAYLKIRNVNPSCTAKFVCVASNSEGSQSKTVDFTVIPQTKPPEISINTTSIDKIIREGDDVVLSCLVTGKTKIYSPWLFKPKYGDNDKEDFEFDTHEVNPLTYRYDLIIKKITIEQAGRYKCITDNDLAESHIDIEVQSGLIPEIEKFPDSGNVVIYNRAARTLFCKVSGSPKPEVTWLYNGQSLNKLNQLRCRYQIESSNNWHNLTINSAITSCNGYYTCVAKSSKGTTEKQITVKVVPPQRPETKVVNSDGSDVVKVNDKVTLTCLVKGDINTPVLWLYNNNIIKIDNVQHKIIIQKHDDESFWYNLKIEQVVLGHKGKYSCKTTVGQSDTYLNVQTPKVPTVLISGSSKIYLPEGEAHTIRCILTGIPIPSGSWEHNNNLISGCTENCQYEINNTTEGTHLILKNTKVGCSGRYNCIAENSVGIENNQFVDVVVIPKEQPDVNIQEPVHAVLNKDVTITCEVTSVDEPTISWKNHDKTVDPIRNKYVIKTAKGANNLYYSTLTIVNFQRSDTADYTCHGSLDKHQNYKTISLKPKTKFKPEFESPDNILDNFELINGDLVFITKVKGYPPPTLEWTMVNPTDYSIMKINPDKSLKENTKFLTETSYIRDDLYWFNHTIKHFDETDSDFHQFIAKNEVGTAKLEYTITYKDSQKPTGGIDIYVDFGNRQILPGSN